MKPTGQVDFAFDTGLMVCLRDDREGVTVGSRTSQIFIVSGQPDTKRAFHRRFA